MKKLLVGLMLTASSLALAMTAEEQTAKHTKGFELFRAKDYDAARIELLAVIDGPAVDKAVGAAVYVVSCDSRQGVGDQTCLDKLAAYQKDLSQREGYTTSTEKLFKGASVYFLNKLKRYPESVVILQESIAATPNNLSSYRTLATVYVQMGRIDDALAMWKMVLVKDNNPTPDKAVAIWRLMVDACRKLVVYDKTMFLEHINHILTLYSALPPPAGTSIALWREQWKPFVDLLTATQTQLQKQLLNQPVQE